MRVSCLGPPRFDLRGPRVKFVDGSELRFEVYGDHAPKITAALVHCYAPHLLYRLTVDPAPAVSESTSCRVEVEWGRHPGDQQEVSGWFLLDWSGAQTMGVAPPSVCIMTPPNELTAA